MKLPSLILPELLDGFIEERITSIDDHRDNIDSIYDNQREYDRLTRISAEVQEKKIKIEKNLQKYQEKLQLSTSEPGINNDSTEDNVKNTTQQQYYRDKITELNFTYIKVKKLIIDLQKFMDSLQKEKQRTEWFIKPTKTSDRLKCQ